MLVTLLKIAGSLGIIGYLFYSAINTPDGRQAFVDMTCAVQRLGIGLLAVGFSTLLLAILITMVRWWYLVRAFGIDFRFPTLCGSAFSAICLIWPRWGLWAAIC